MARFNLNGGVHRKSKVKSTDVDLGFRVGGFGVREQIGASEDDERKPNQRISRLIA
ncbi:hypothetical protein GBA52_012226 [Prunus armeniaca]|nr:hypothetical protein GBA52_012226 [Prunus armeniaca]